MPPISSYDRQILNQAREIQRREAAEKRAERKARARKVAKPKPERKPILTEKDGRQRQPRLKDKEHLARIRQLPCLPTLITTGQEVYGVDACHVRSLYPEWPGITGMQRKPDDWRTLPMTRAWHSAQHAMREAKFWSDLNVYPPTVCAALRDATDLEAMLAIIRQVAAEVRRAA